MVRGPIGAPHTLQRATSLRTSVEYLPARVSAAAFFSRVIAASGHTLAQVLHPKQSEEVKSKLTLSASSRYFTAFVGHALAHAPQSEHFSLSTL
ncbi:MAG: hypothetical protein QXW88_00325, partial [Thermofilum sp.]